MSAHKTDPHETQLSPTARKFLEENTMREIFGIPEAALDAVMATAYQLYQAGRYPEVEVLCRVLIAADHKYWWSYSLYAAALRRLGRLREALAQLDTGLAYEPDAAEAAGRCAVSCAEAIANEEHGEPPTSDAAIETDNNDSHAPA